LQAAPKKVRKSSGFEKQTELVNLDGAMAIPGTEKTVRIGKDKREFEELLKRDCEEFER